MAYVKAHISKCLKEELAWAIDKQLQGISNKMLFKIVIPLRNERIKPYNNIVCVAMWPLVMCSN